MVLKMLYTQCLRSFGPLVCRNKKDFDGFESDIPQTTAQFLKSIVDDVTHRASIAPPGVLFL